MTSFKLGFTFLNADRLMFFLFRVFFWLSLIMLVVWWSGGAGSHKPGSVEVNLQKLSALAGTGLDEAKTRLEQACLQRPKMCIDLLSNYTRDETQKPVQSPSSLATANKIKGAVRHQNQTAPQGRDPAN